MSLVFGSANTTRLNCGSGANLDDLTSFTMLAWVNPSTLTTGRVILAKGAVASAKVFRLSGTGGNINLYVNRATTDANYITSDTPLSATGAWAFIAATYDEGATPSIHIYTGTLAALAAENGYGTSTDGSGTTDVDNTLAFYVGNATTNNVAFQGSVGPCAYISGVLTLAQIQAWQFRPRVIVNTRGLWFPGQDGVDVQADRSGNGNNGTIVGATQGAFVPLGPLFGSDIAMMPYVVAAGGTNTPKSVDGTLTSAGAISKATGKVVAGTLTSAGATVKAVDKTFAGTLTTAGALAKNTAKAFVGTLTSSGTLSVAAIFARTLEGTLTTAGSLAKSTAKTMAGALTSSGALSASRTFLAVLEGTLTTAGALAKSTGKMAEGTLTSAGSLARSVSKFVAGTLTSAGTIAKDTGKTVAGTLSLSGTLTTANAYLISLAGTLTSSGALSKATGKTLTGTLTLAGTVNKAIGKIVAGALSFVGALTSLLAGGSVPKLDVMLSDAAVTTVTLVDSATTVVTLSDSSRG
jgi:hypothetical protein